MGTPINPAGNVLSVTINELSQSIHPEEQEQAQKLKAIVNEFLTELKPILRHICYPLGRQGVRGVNLEMKLPIGIFSAPTLDAATLVLEEKGMFGAILFFKQRAMLTGDAQYVDVQYVDVLSAFLHVPFSELMAVLTTTLNRARAKKEQFAASIREREKMADDIMAIIRGTATVVPKT